MTHVTHKLDHKLKIKSEDLISHLHLFDIDLISNHIYLTGVDRGYDISGIEEAGVEHVMASRFIKNINICMRTNPDKPIVVHMKSCGGDWNEGMAIYDAIKTCPSRVVILNYTHARSMTSLIFQAADKRVMMPHSHFMFHDGDYAVAGTVKQVKSNIEFDKTNEYEMLNIYAEKMNEKGSMAGHGLIKIKGWLRKQMDKKEDVFLTAKEAVKLGLADAIFNNDWSKLAED